MRVPKPSGHLWKFLATGAAGLTVGTVQGVIQVQPAQRGLALAGRARGRVDRSDQSRAHQPGHRPDDADGRRALLPGARCSAAKRRHGVSRTSASGRCWAARSRSTASRSTSASTRGGSWSRHGLTPEQAEEATRLHPFLIMGAGHRDDGRLLVPARDVVRSCRARAARSRPFVLAGCAALAVGTLQGPVRPSRPSTSCSIAAVTPGT